MSSDMDAGRDAPPRPTVTRAVRRAGMTGGLVPPFLPGHRYRLPASRGTAATAGEAGGAGGEAASQGGESAARGREDDDGIPAAEGWPDVLEEGSAMAAWDSGDEGAATPAADEHGDEDQPEADAAFPIEAFFVPGDSQRIPSGYHDADHRAIAARVAARLEEMAAQVRQEGIAALGATKDADELTRLIAGVVAGFFARER
jgi:hypothetical protein